MPIACRVTPPLDVVFLLDVDNTLLDNDAVERDLRRNPAGHYVMMDDRLRILALVKTVWGTRLTTAFVRQGHDACDPSILAAYPPTDLSIERIGDLADSDLTAVLP